MYYLKIVNQILTVVLLKDPTIDYTAQMKILAVANTVLREQIESLSQEREELREHLLSIEETFIVKKDENMKELSGKRSYLRQEMQIALERGRKRCRRSAQDIYRPYVCPYLPCDKAYG